MKYIQLIFLYPLFLLLTTCGGGEGASDSANIAGVAATGAPIVNGMVEVKGLGNNIEKSKTDSKGIYRVPISSLQPPFMVRVTAQSGQQLISVATMDDLVERKIINVNPITHTITANIIGDKDPSTSFSNFDGSNVSRESITAGKNALKAALITAGVIKDDGSGIVQGEDVDLMNGKFTAGSGDGIDKLLDVLDIDLEKGASIIVKIKGGTKEIINKAPTPGGNYGTIDPIDSNDKNLAEAQITILRDIKTRLNSIAEKFSDMKICKGDAVVHQADINNPVEYPLGDAKFCDKYNLGLRIGKFFHSQYKQDDLNVSTDKWNWFCRGPDDSNANGAAGCTVIDGEVITLKDISILEYKDADVDGVVEDGDEAFVSLNVYMNGVMETADILRLKRENSKWQFFGNQMPFDTHISTRSIYLTNFHYIWAAEGVEPEKDSYTDYDYRTGISTWAHPSSGTGFILKSVKNPPGVNQPMERDTSMNMSEQLIFTNRKYICPDGSYSINPTKNTMTCHQNYNSNFYDLFGSEYENMGRFEKFTLESGSTSPIGFYLIKPFKINENNAERVTPSFSRSIEDLCSGEHKTFSVKAGEGGTLRYINIYYSYGTGGSWQVRRDLEGGAPAQYLDFTDEGDSSGVNLQYAGFYLDGANDLGQRVIREINCSNLSSHY